MAIELRYKRNHNSKTLDNENGSFQLDAHIGHIHYFNKLGIGDSNNDFRGIDWTLSWDDVRRGWYFQYHSFHPFIPEYADEWVEFRDLYQGKDQTIRLRAVADTDFQLTANIPNTTNYKDGSGVLTCRIYQ
jgi:hypothetical protein